MPMTANSWCFARKETYDGATPSRQRCGGVCPNVHFQADSSRKMDTAGDRQQAFLAASVKDYPAAHCFALMAAQLELYTSKEVVVTSGSKADTVRFKKAVAQRLAPHISVLVKTQNNQARLSAIAPFTKDYPVTPGSRFIIFVIKRHAQRLSATWTNCLTGCLGQNASIKY